jgi:hypothetical protein
MKKIAIIASFIMLFSGYTFCQGIDDPDKVISQKNEIQSSEEAKDVTKVASESEKTKDVTKVISDESKTAPEYQESEGLASKIADTAEKIANATSGSSMFCGVGGMNLPQAILCGGVQATNLLSNGIAYIFGRISKNESESKAQGIGLDRGLLLKEFLESKSKNKPENESESKPEKYEPSWRL